MNQNKKNNQKKKINQINKKDSCNQKFNFQDILQQTLGNLQQGNGQFNFMNILQNLQNPEFQNQFQDLFKNFNCGNQGQQNFFELFKNFQNPNQSQEQNQPKVNYDEKISILKTMGFYDEQRNLELLKKHGGNIERVIQELVQ